MNFAHGKTVLVTGATDGIGKATAMALAHAGAKVVVHGRDRARAEATLHEIEATTGNRDCSIAIADFTSLAQVRALAADIRDEHPDLRVLINNAGIYSGRYHLSQDGFELTFAVNHLAPFLLTNLLLDMLIANAPARIVTVSSTLHRSAGLDLAIERGERRYDGHETYATSKLANVLFTFELAERLRGTGVTANCLHPGGVNTKLLRAGFGAGGMSPAEGARTSVYLATAPELENVTGKYFAREHEAEPDPRARDTALRRRFFELSAELAGLA